MTPNSEGGAGAAGGARGWPDDSNRGVPNGSGSGWHWLIRRGHLRQAVAEPHLMRAWWWNGNSWDTEPYRGTREPYAIAERWDYVGEAVVASAAAQVVEPQCDTDDDWQAEYAGSCLLSVLGLTYHDATVGLGCDEWLVIIYEPRPEPDVKHWSGFPVRYSIGGGRPEAQEAQPLEAAP